MTFKTIFNPLLKKRLQYYTDPRENFRTVSDILERDAIPVGERVVGSTLVYVESNGHFYNLIGGIANIDWDDYGTSLGGGGTNNFIENITAGENLLINDIVYLGTDGKYYKTDYTDESKCTTELKICKANILTDAIGEVYIRGVISGFVGLSTGVEYYLYTNGGIIDILPNVDNIFQRYVGTAVSATHLYFNPDSDYLELTTTIPVPTSNKATQIQVDAGVDDTTFITPLTFTNADKWDDYALLTYFEKPVLSLADLPTPILGVIQLEDNLTYRFQGLINIGANTIRVGISNTLFGFDKSNDGIIYTGTGNAIEVVNQTLSIVNIFLNGTGGLTSKLISVTNSLSYSFQIRECIIAGNTQAGEVIGSNIIAINNNIHASNLTYGWDILGTNNKVGIDSNYFENYNIVEHIHLENGNYNTIKITNNDFSINSPNQAILVDNTVVINNIGAGLIISNTFVGSGDFINGINATTLQWIIEDNGRKVLNTSATITQRKVRSEAELDLYLAEPDPTKYSYLIDAEEFLITKPITVPGSGVNGGLTFFGLGNNYTKINTVTPNISMFDGGGNLFLNDLIVACEGVNSKVFGVTSTTGFEAVEMININFQDCEDLGFISGYRQGLLINGFIINVKKGLEFQGVWSGGFRISDSRFIFTPTVGSYMFKSAIGNTFASRFVSNANSTIGTGSVGYDFRENSFINDANFQIIEAQFNGGGTYINGITQSSIKSLWRDNVGVDDTFQGCVYNNSADTVTTIGGGNQNVYVELETNTVVIENTWFQSDSVNKFRALYLSTLPINIRIDLAIALSSGTNNEIDIDIRKYESDNVTFTSLSVFRLTTNGGVLGTRVEPLTIPTFARVTQNQRIRIFVRNTSATTNISLEAGSKLIISKR